MSTSDALPPEWSTTIQPTVQHLREQARAAPKGRPVRCVFATTSPDVGWEARLSSKGEGSWRLGLQLIPIGRSSTETDWEALGILTRSFGAPREGWETPIERTHPNDVHWIRWTEGTAAEDPSDAPTPKPPEETWAAFTAMDVRRLRAYRARMERPEAHTTGKEASADPEGFADRAEKALAEGKSIELRPEDRGAPPPGIDLPHGIRVIYSVHPGIVPGTLDRHFSVSRRHKNVAQEILDDLRRLFDISTESIPIVNPNSKVAHWLLFGEARTTDAAPPLAPTMADEERATWDQRPDPKDDAFALLTMTLPDTGIAPIHVEGVDARRYLLKWASSWPLTYADNDGDTPGAEELPHVSDHGARGLGFRRRRLPDRQGYVEVQIRTLNGGVQPRRYAGEDAIDRCTRFCVAYVGGWKAGTGTTKAPTA